MLGTIGVPFSGAGADCLVLLAGRVRVRVRASSPCVRFPWRPVCVQVTVPWVVPCVVRGGVVELSWMRALVSYPRMVHACFTT